MITCNECNNEIVGSVYYICLGHALEPVADGHIPLSSVCPECARKNGFDKPGIGFVDDGYTTKMLNEEIKSVKEGR